MRRYLCTLALVLGASISFGQQGEPCEIDYSILRQKILASPDQLTPGAALYLDADFLSRLEDPDQFRTVAAYYEYLRPATRKERRLDTIKSATVARVMEDGNVYKEVALSHHTGFFQTTKFFQGSFEPLSTGAQWTFPPGLSPVNITAFRNEPFRLLEYRATYAVLECRGKQIAFYPILAPMRAIFHTTKTKSDLAHKTAFARSLLGQIVSIANEGDPAKKFIELELADCRVTRDYAIFSYWAEEAGYLYIDDLTDFTIYENSCIEQMELHLVPQSPEIPNRVNEMLDQIARGEMPITELQENPVLIELLLKRFHKARDEFAGITWYLHKDQTPEVAGGTTFLRANINSNGVMYLQSNYFSGEPLDHIAIALRIGSRVVTSREVPRSESRNLREVFPEGIEEQIHFTKGEDGDMLELIARNTNSPVEVTFVSDSGRSHAIMLAEVHKQAIRDVYVLNRLILSR